MSNFPETSKTDSHLPNLLQGLNVFIGLAVLTAIEFFIAITNASLLLIGMIAVLKAGLVLYFYMHVYHLRDVDKHLDPHTYQHKLTSNRFGLWLFLLSDAFLFAGLLSARFNLMGLTRLHLDQTLGLIVTVVLLVSSFFMNRAESQMKLGNKKSFLLNTAITTLLGLGFVIGVVAIEWPSAAREGITASASAGSAIFYMMTGMHAFHVITGLIFLLIVLRNGMNDRYTPEQHWAVEAATVYWHFIDLVWIFFYPALYLIGRLG
ncbi:MAG: cytochrome c oxidase subunit 3 [Anaerolineales bacterium]|jgi:cytochrome c oxidase subunit 3|nr:cytochrome c oxidase subunit 3 [Anaerolineales bacterium]